MPDYGYTVGEMVDMVAGTIGNISIASKIMGWLNLATTDLASKYVFGSLHAYGTAATANGIPFINLADNFYWLKHIAIPALNKKLYPIDERLLSEQYPKYRITKGTPSRYYLNGKLCGIWQVPSATYSVDYSYQCRPLKLVNVDDTSDLPPEWHPLLIQKAISKGYHDEGNDNGFAISMQLEARLLRELQMSIYRRPDEAFVLDSPRTSGHLPRPKLPSNFPVS